MLRIGIVCHPAYGGSGVVASELGLALAAKGHQVHFVSHELPFRVPASHPNTVFHRVDVTSYPLFKYPPYTLALATRLFGMCSEERLDILHVHYAIPHSIAAYLCRQMLGNSRPHVLTTLHGTDITLIGLDKTFHAITRFAINQSDMVTAVSNYLAEETRSRFQPEKEIVVVPNFIDGKVFTPELRSLRERMRYSLPDEKIVGHLSNFRSVKRVPDVVRTFHLIQKQVSARLLLIGKGVEEEPARHLAAELGILDRVEFLGPVENIAEVLAQLDLFLLPSEYESFGLAALEAMACGVPVVCSKAGGIPEVVEDQVSGLLCSVGDYACMAEASVELLQDTDRHKAMGEAGRRRALECYPLDSAVRRYESLYESLLNGE